MKQEWNDPHEIERVSKFAKDSDREAFWWQVNQVLGEVNFEPQGPIDPESIPVTFICGAPRSGTTLLSALLSKQTQVGYISNLIARFWNCPELGIHLMRDMFSDWGRSLIDFSSEFGTTTGIANPHEFGYFWRHWLSLDSANSHALTEGEYQRLDVEGLSHAVGSMCVRFDRPMLFKNLICGMNINWLSQVFPRSKFLVLTRDHEDVCRSMLRARYQRTGDITEWWSVKPPNFETLNAEPNPAIQVSGQLRSILERIDDGLRAVDGERWMKINYSDICTEPNSIVKKCAAFMNVEASSHEVELGLPTIQSVDSTIEKRIDQLLKQSDFS